MAHHARIRVRYGEVDQQGVVYNAHYLAYVDDVFDTWLRELAPQFEELGWEIMLKKASLEWHGSAGMGDVLDVTTEVVRWGNKVVLPGQIKELNAAIFINTTNPPAGLVTSLHTAAVLALGSYVTDTNKVQVQPVTFDTTERDQMLAAVGSSNFWTHFWDVGKSFMYIVLLVGGLYLVVRTFRNTSEEFIPTGMTVGEMLADRMADEAAITAGAEMAVAQAQATTVQRPGVAGVAQGPGVVPATEAIVEEVEEDEVEMITEEKKKLVMDFGLGKKQPERVTVEVLKDLIAEKPEKMSQAARSWLLSDDDSAGNL